MIRAGARKHDYNLALPCAFTAHGFLKALNAAWFTAPTGKQVSGGAEKCIICNIWFLLAVCLPALAGLCSAVPNGRENKSHRAISLDLGRIRSLRSTADGHH